MIYLSPPSKGRRPSWYTRIDGEYKPQIEELASDIGICQELSDSA